MARTAKLLPAYGYMRTSSATNVGVDKDSEGRQRHAIESYAKTHGYDVDGWYYDAAVRGADRPGFGDMLAAIAADGVRTILIESPDRFARDLAVQLAGHDHLKRLGVALVPSQGRELSTPAPLRVLRSRTACAGLGTTCRG
jgi:DNA invertase Pin-like site-specific DNA recombinase